MLGGELEQIGQLAERAARAEVVGVGLERRGVAGIVLQDGVQVDRGLLLIAQPVAVERRQLAQERQPVLGIGGPFELLLAQLGQLAVVVPAEIELGQVLRRRPARLLQREDLLVGADGLLQVVERGLGQAGAFGEDFDLLLVGAGVGDALAQEAVEVGEAARFGEHAFEQGQRLGVEGHRAQGLAQGRHGVVDVARLVPPARDLVVEAGRALGAVRPRPVRVGEDRGQGLQRLVVARIEADHVGKPLRGGRQVADLLGQDAPQPEHEGDAPLGIGGAGQLDLVEPANHGVVPQGVVDLARRLDHLELLGGDLGPQPGRRERVLDAGDVLAVHAIDLGAQLGDAGGILRLGEGSGLDLQHLEILVRAALLAVDVLQALDRLAVGGVTADRVGQVGLGPGHVRELVDPDLGRQVEELGRLGLVGDGLRARFVEGDELVEASRLPIRSTQEEKGLVVAWLPLQGLFVLSLAGHAALR